MGCDSGFLPIINYGKWAGPSYAGGVCLTQAGQAFDQSLLAISGIDFIDSITKNHDINYEYVSRVFGAVDEFGNANPNFTPTPEYYRALFAADVEMLQIKGVSFA